MTALNQHLALVFLPDALCVALWQSLDGRTSILAQSDFTPLESTTLPAISTALDSVLDQLGEAGLRVKDCLFCVPNSWTEGGGLRGEKKAILKQISDDLMLKPLGFVVNSDALAAANTLRTGHPFTGLVLFVSDLAFNAELYTNGELVKSEEVGRSQIETDISELLTRLPATLTHILIVESSSAAETKSLETLLQQDGRAIEIISRASFASTTITTGGGETLVNQSGSTPAAASQSEKKTQPAEDEDGSFKPPAFLINQTAPPATAVVDAEPVTAEPEQKPAGRRFAWPHWSWPHWQLAWPRLAVRRSWWLGIIPVAAALLGAFWWLKQSYRAVVAVEINSQLIETEQTFLLAAADADLSSATTSALRAQPVTESVSVDKEVPTTGSKIIGDPAKGKVTIFNRTTQAKNFPAGTRLVNNKLVFTLDSETTVASSSAANDYAPGSVEANITATAIGPAGNLNKDTEFAVANFDVTSYVAKNKEPLGGGNSREIQAVSAKDIEQAKNDLQQAATEQLRERFSGSSSDAEPVFFTGVTNIMTENATAKIGEEKKFVGVSLTVEGTGAKLTKADITAAAHQFLALPDGLTLQEETIKLNPVEVTDDHGQLWLRAKLEARGVPVVDQAQIKEKVMGQYAARAQTLLSDNPLFSQVKVEIQPAWTNLFFKHLPNDRDRVEVTVRLKESS